MTTPASPDALARALTFAPGPDGALRTEIEIGFSNGPQAMDPLKGAPFGGLMAALAGEAARQGLEIAAPIRSLTIQYLAAAQFREIDFVPTLSRGGRNLSYASVTATQDDRPMAQALVTFGRDVAGPDLKPMPAPPGTPGDFTPEPMQPDFGPWFTKHIEHRFPQGPRLFGLNAGGSVELGCWMRCIDGLPLDEARLLFLLDGLYPTYFTAFPGPPAISASVDLRADLLAPLTPETSPEGWAYFHFVSRDVGGGWAVEDGTAQGLDGAPLALVRQRRRIMPTRG
jgi:acyl-CoA thioesterase